MASEETQFQLVTFQLGDELYGVNIMDVKEIVRLQNVRVIPNSPYYVEGIINLRGEIIPIIDLHKRFRIQALAKEETDFEGGFIILNIDNNKIGIIIDKVACVIVNDLKIAIIRIVISVVAICYLDSSSSNSNRYRFQIICNIQVSECNIFWFRKV